MNFYRTDNGQVTPLQHDNSVYVGTQKKGFFNIKIQDFTSIITMLTLYTFAISSIFFSFLAWGENFTKKNEMTTSKPMLKYSDTQIEQELSPPYLINMTSESKNLNKIENELMDIKQNIYLQNNSYRKIEFSGFQSEKGRNNLINLNSEQSSMEKNTSAWSVVATSKDIAFIKNIFAEIRMKVTHGTKIPGCGVVENINPVKQTVSAGSCLITRNYSALLMPKSLINI